MTVPDGILHIEISSWLAIRLLQLGAARRRTRERRRAWLRWICCRA